MDVLSRHEVVIFIRATPKDIWRAMTDPILTRDYYYGTAIVSDWTPGARWTSEANDELYLEGEIVEIDEPHRLVQTFHVAIEKPAANDPPSTVTWEITPMGDSSRLKLVHDGMGAATREYVEDGWELILSSLKTLLETGQPLKIGQAATM